VLPVPDGDVVVNALYLCIDDHVTHGATVYASRDWHPEPGSKYAKAHALGVYVIDEGQLADLLEIQGANPFRVRAYRNVARTIGTLGTPVQTILKDNGHALDELPGIGADLAGEISGCLRIETGSCCSRMFARHLQPSASTRRG
jgi:hypothetical protein